MLELGRKLPPGALIGSESGPLVQMLARTLGARFLARDQDMVRTDGNITGWSAAYGGIVADTSEPNIGNSRFDPEPVPGLICSEGINCGFVIPAFAPKVGQFTAAIIYSSAGEARTLASISTGKGNNQIFVNETKGQWVAMDRAGTVSLEQRRPAGWGLHLVILSYADRRLALSAGGKMLTAAADIPAIDYPADFFIGCRSNRTGLSKTVGEARLHEVLFWPDRALIGSTAEDDIQASRALDRYFRWTY